MDEESKKQIAVFRFGVIADFVTGARLPQREKSRLLADKCARRWSIPFTHRTSIGKSTVRDWIARYETGGRRLEALYPRDRTDTGRSRSIDDETAATLMQLRREMPRAPVARVIEEMRKRGLIGEYERLAPTSVWRLFTKHGLMPSADTPAENQRKFEAELPNDIWQSDVMHGPRAIVDGRAKKTYLIAFIDDHSRLIPYARFYLSENLACFLDAFEKAMLKRGVPRKLYVDNGSAYRSHQLEHTCASLAMALIHARAYQPQGKGKIERIFRSLRAQMLTTVPDPITLQDLNERLDQWLHTYHQRRHSATGQTPLQRFTDHMQCLRPAPDDLKDHFRTVARRTVARDRTVTLDGRLFEAPVELIGKRIDVLYHKDTPHRVEARLKNKTYGYLRAVDLNVNCRVKRDKNIKTQLTDSSSTPSGGKVW